MTESTGIAADRANGLWGFNDLLLGGMFLLIVTLFVLVGGLYVLSSQDSAIPALQPGVRVAAVEDFPVGASRVVSWGDDLVLVVRAGEEDYFAVQGTSAADGCILRWDVASSRVVSPCTYAVYDQHGHVVRGLTTEPLRRYAVFLRDGAVYATDW